MIKFLRKKLRNLIIKIGRILLGIPFIGKPGKKVLGRFPRLFKRLERMLNEKSDFPVNTNQQLTFNNLSLRAKKIYNDLLMDIDRKKKSDIS